jgi:ATP phosphoribosyltransferase
MQSDIAGISESGNVYRSSIKAKKGHTVVVMHPGRQNTRDGAIQTKQLVYYLENATSNSAEGQEQMIWLIDYKGWSMKNSIPLSVVREIANILQNHYPERLHVAVVYNLPRLFEAIWKMVKPFLDPKTFCKIKFVYAKNTESQKILDELFEEDAVKGMFDDSEDYNFKEYADLMQEDDLKSALYWKGAGAGENMVEQVEIRNETVPKVILALPIGGLLAQDTICFMKDCQLSVRQHLHDIPELQNVQVSLEESEAKVVHKLRAGDVHMGIVGYDMLLEYGEHDEVLIIVHDALGYGAAQLVLMIPALGYYANVNSLKELDAMPRYNYDKTPLRIVTSYPHLAQKFLEEQGLKNVELHLIGATSQSHSQSKLWTSLLRICGALSMRSLNF